MQFYKGMYDKKRHLHYLLVEKKNSSLPYVNSHFYLFSNHAVYRCRKVAYCDAAATTYGANDTPDLVSDINHKIYDLIHDLRFPTKEYPLELKPLTYAFGFKHFSLTTLRAFLLYYLPLLEPQPPKIGRASCRERVYVLV